MSGKSPDCSSLFGFSESTNFRSVAWDGDTENLLLAKKGHHELWIGGLLLLLCLNRKAARWDPCWLGRMLWGLWGIHVRFNKNIYRVSVKDIYMAWLLIYCFRRSFEFHFRSIAPMGWPEAPLDLVGKWREQVALGGMFIAQLLIDNNPFRHFRRITFPDCEFSKLIYKAGPRTETLMENWHTLEHDMRNGQRNPQKQQTSSFYLASWYLGFKN